MTSNGANAPATDPSVYDHLTEKWVALPINETEWFQRAIDVVT